MNEKEYNNYKKFIKQMYLDKVKIQTKDWTRDQFIEEIAISHLHDDEDNYFEHGGQVYFYLNIDYEQDMLQKFREKKND